MAATKEHMLHMQMERRDSHLVSPSLQPTVTVHVAGCLRNTARHESQESWDFHASLHANSTKPDKTRDWSQSREFSKDEEDSGSPVTRTDQFKLLTQVYVPSHPTMSFLCRLLPQIPPNEVLGEEWEKQKASHIKYWSNVSNTGVFLDISQWVLQV